MKRSKLYVGLMGSCAIFVAAPAFSQDAKDQSAVALQEVVVTAQRRDESLQKVPVAVTAITQVQIQQARIANIQDLSSLAPNLQVNNQGNQSISNVSIRGISSGLQNVAVDPKVGMYIDGVYIGRSVGNVFDLADIKQIEVLRGPQGTLFGRNATAGAISITTADPTGEFGGTASLSYGNYNALRARASVNLPAYGPLSVRISYLHDQIDGDVTNLYGGKFIDLTPVSPAIGRLRYADKLDEYLANGVQLAAKLEFGKLRFNYAFDYTDTHSSAHPVQGAGILDSGPVVTPIIVGLFGLQSLTGGVTNLSTSPLASVVNSSSEEHLVTQGHSLRATWDVNDALTLKSITGYRKFKEDPVIWDNCGCNGLLIPNSSGGLSEFHPYIVSRTSRQWQITEEVQALVTERLWTLTAGAFFFHENSPETAYYGPFKTVTDGVIDPPYDRPDITQALNDSYAAYGQFTFHVTSKIDLTAGVRYTVDSRETIVSSTTGSTSGALTTGDYKTSFYHLNYTAIATYRPNDNLTVYVKDATGYNAGGIYNGIPFRPEDVDSYEAGLKSEFWDRRVRANFAGYYAKYQELQTQNFSSTTGLIIFGNAGRAHLYGFEAEVTALPIENLTLSGNLGYANLVFDQYVQLGVDIADIARTYYVAKLTADLSADYRAPLRTIDASAYIQLNARYRSKAPLSNVPVTDYTGNPALDQWAYTTAFWNIDGRLGLADLPVAGRKLDLSIYVRNLTDKRAIDYGGAVFVQGISYARGRTFGIEARVNF